MIGRVLRFVRLPLLLLLIFAIARFMLGANGVPYAPRGNAMFSIVGLSFVSAVYFGALSRRIGRIRLGRHRARGLQHRTLGPDPDLHGHLAELRHGYRDLVLPALGRAQRCGRHRSSRWPPAMQTRAGGLVVGPLIVIVPALIGRLLSALAPEPGAPTR